MGLVIIVLGRPRRSLDQPRLAGSGLSLWGPFMPGTAWSGHMTISERHILQGTFEKCHFRIQEIQFGETDLDTTSRPPALSIFVSQNIGSLLDRLCEGLKRNWGWWGEIGLFYATFAFNGISSVSCLRRENTKIRNRLEDMHHKKSQKNNKRYFSPTAGRFASQMVPKKLSLAKNKTQNKVKMKIL